MFQFFLKLRRRPRAAAARRAAEAETARFAGDPLSHPAIRAMRPHELADIPFPRPEPLQPERACRRGGSG